MSTSVIFLLLFFFFFFFAHGVQSKFVKEYQDEVSGHEGECLGKDHKFYKLGEAIKDEPCAVKVCRGTAAPGSVYMDVERCPNVDKKDSCRLKSGSKKEFPVCCSKLVCD